MKDRMRTLVMAILVLEALSPASFIIWKTQFDGLFMIAVNLVFSLILAIPYGLLALLSLWLRKLCLGIVLAFSLVICIYSFWIYCNAYNLTRPDQGPELVFFMVFIYQLPVVLIFSVVMLSVNWMLKKYFTE